MFQDWTPVGWNKQGTKQTNETKKDFLKRESQAGRVISSMNNTTCNKAGSNGLNDKVMSARKLDEEEDTFKHKSVSLSISKRIAQKRCEMKLTQKELANMPIARGRKVTTEVVKKESDWKKYFGSAKPILALIKDGKQEDFTRQILQLVPNKKLLTYYECKYMFNHSVLENPDKWFNDNILGKFYSKDFL